MFYRFCMEDRDNFEIESETENAALIAAWAHFNNPKGKWFCRNEGEDASGNVTHETWQLIPSLFLASFTSNLYPEDNEVLGIFPLKTKRKR